MILAREGAENTELHMTWRCIGHNVSVFVWSGKEGLKMFCSSEISTLLKLLIFYKLITFQIRYSLNVFGNLSNFALKIHLLVKTFQ